MVVFILVFLRKTTGFLTANNQCYDVCTCVSRSEINCNSRGLQTFPVFDLPTQFSPWDILTFKLDHNKFIEIPHGVFRNFTKLSTLIHQDIQVVFDLRSNQIAQINNGAFLGLESLFIELHLEDNNLTSISDEFTRLTGLRKLSIERNPLGVFGIPDKVIMQMFYNNNIWEINLSSYELLRKVMRYQLNTITKLGLFDINETRFDQGLFVKGQTTALKTVEIDSCAFSDISEVLCNLDLRKAIFSRCKNINDTTLQGCSQNNTVFLEIDYCGTTDALDPSAFYSASLWAIILSGQFHQVPRTLLSHCLTYLRLLSIEMNNTITLIDDEAFNATPTLEYLFLNMDPLAKLTPSIKNLYLSQLGLPDMMCSCATMGAVKGYDFSPVDITGNCINIPGCTIQDYLNNDISACP